MTTPKNKKAAEKAPQKKAEAPKKAAAPKKEPQAQEEAAEKPYNDDEWKHRGS